MRFFLKQNDLLDEAEIHIYYKDIDEKLQNVIDRLQLIDFSVMGKKDGAIHKIALENIYYFESVDDKIFAYCEVDVYEVSYKLYELEHMVSEYSFARISKSYSGITQWSIVYDKENLKLDFYWQTDYNKPYTFEIK